MNTTNEAETAKTLTRCATTPVQALAVLRRGRAPRSSLRRVPKLALCALMLLGGVSAGEPLENPLSAAQASKVFAKQTKQQLRDMRKGAQLAVKQLKFELSELVEPLDGGDADMLAFAEDTLDVLESFVRTLTGQTFTGAVNLDAQARDVLADAPELTALPEAFQVGAGSVVDRVPVQVERVVLQAERKAQRLVSRFRKQVADAQGWALNVMLNPTRHTQPLAPVLHEDGVSLVNFPFAIEVLLAISDPEVDDDGLLGFAVLLPGNQGDELTSILIGEQSLFEFGGPWVVDDGGRTRGLLGTDEGLSESSYKLVIDRFGTQVSRSISVP